MNLITYDNMTGCIFTICELKLMASSLQAMNEKHENERTMTRQLKNSIITMLVAIENRIVSLEEISPELSQSLYDDFLEIEKLHILQNIPDEL